MVLRNINEVSINRGDIRKLFDYFDLYIFYLFYMLFIIYIKIETKMVT